MIILRLKLFDENCCQILKKAVKDDLNFQKVEVFMFRDIRVLILIGLILKTWAIHMFEVT